MESTADRILVSVPREGVNDDIARVVQWLVPNGKKVQAQEVLVVLETTKATLELEAPSDGYVFHLAQAGMDVAVGAPVAVLSSHPQQPHLDSERTPAQHTRPSEQVVTNRARDLISEHGLSLDEFAHLPVVRAVDVQTVLRERRVETETTAVCRFRGEALDPKEDWDGIFQTDLYRELCDLLTQLRKRMYAKFNRHLSTGNLLHDRWDLARDHGFGEGTSVYDDCLILGDVRVGQQCWIGPGTVLDGLHSQLIIGDFVDIGAGAHLYTHNTIERALTGRKAPLFHRSTRVGSCCFIAPHAILAPGTVLGDHCFVAAASYVEGSFPTCSYIAGNPAKRVGTVEVDGNRARIRMASLPPSAETEGQ
jgi:acetyltransferase-like isoleucine patch superfamily enzyme